MTLCFMRGDNIVMARKNQLNKDTIIECEEWPLNTISDGDFLFQDPHIDEKFFNIMDFANRINQHCKKHQNIGVTHPLFDIIKLLGRKIQLDYLLKPLYLKESELLLDKTLDSDNLFINHNDIISTNEQSFEDIKIHIENYESEVNLNTDIVLPWPWSQDRYAKAITSIGEGRKKGAWTMDEPNHSLELWLPIGISWVYSGNHSIASGIIQNIGSIKPEYVYDISRVYDFVQCNGQNFIRKHDNSIISPVRNVEFAAIFEIGRMITQNNSSTI